MPRIILPNFRTDYSENVREWSGFVEGTKAGTDTSARFLWHAEDGDVFVIPDSIDPGFKEYVASFVPGNVTVLAVDRTLNEVGLLDDEFVDELRALVKNPSEWTLFPCVATRAAAELAEQLGFPPLPGSAFARQSGIDLLNMKSTFRRLAAGVGTPIADGVVARSPREIARALVSMSKKTGMMIAKQDRSGGGHGNIGLTYSDEDLLPGTRETRSLSTGFDDLAEGLWEDLSDTLNQFVVVEAYHPADHRFYFEYYVGDDGLEFLDNGILRYGLPPGDTSRSPKWAGIDLPLHLDPQLHPEVVAHVEKFLDVVRRIGYRGYVNIDGIVMPDGRLIFHEINARWGGGLVYHTIAERLLGPDYASSHAVSSVLDISPAPLDSLLGDIKRAGIGFDPDKKEGVVVLGCNSDLGPGAECLVMASSDERVQELKALLREFTEGSRSAS